MLWVNKAVLTAESVGNHRRTLLSISLQGRALLPNPYSPQENLLFVEQARKPVIEHGARCELDRDFRASL